MCSRRAQPLTWYQEFDRADGILKGKRIVSLSTVLAAPAAGCILSDLGAEVIKVEEPKGDVLRGIAHSFQRDRKAQKIPCTFFEYANRGVKSVTLNMKESHDQAQLRSLLATADAFITNHKMVNLKDWGIDYESLKESHPSLVYTHFTAYGLDGPMAEDIGYDAAAFNAALGMMNFMKAPEDPGMPRFIPSFGDITCSVGIAAATTLAITEKAMTGKGQLVHTSLLNNSAWCMSGAILPGKDEKKASANEALDVLMGSQSWGNKSFRTADQEWLAFSCLELQEQEKALAAFGITAGEGVEEKLREHISKTNLADCLDVLKNADVDWAAGAVYAEDSMKSAVFQRLAAPLPGMKDCDDVLRQPLTFESHDAKPIQRAPPLGFHNNQIFGPNGARQFDETHDPAATTEMTTTRGHAFKSFTDVRVVELGKSVAAAAAGAQLADLGMEVIKVEAAGGDPTRSLGCSVHTHLNRGKKNVTCDDPAKLVKLLETADILLVSIPKEELEKMGLDWAALKTQCPKLLFIHVSPQGYGKGGWHGLGAEYLPYHAGGGGLADCLRAKARVSFPDDPAPLPQLVPLMGEHATSLHIVLAAATGLYHRGNSGEGQKIEVMLEAAILWPLHFQTTFIQWAKNVLHKDATSDMKERFPSSSRGVDDNFIRLEGGTMLPGMQAYKCKDGYVNLLELEMFKPLPKILKALDEEKVAVTKKSAIKNALFNLGGVMDRVRNYLMTYITTYRTAFENYTVEEAVATLKAGDVRVIAVGDMRDADEHPQLKHLGMKQDGYIKCPMMLSSSSDRSNNKVPKLGEHNSEFGL